MLNAVRNPESIATLGLASSAFARHYLRNLFWCLFLALLRCFSSDRSPRTPIWFNARYMDIVHVGCPIRISPDISLVYSSPRLFAVSHVLLRLPVPRHSPCALLSLTFWRLSTFMWSSFVLNKKWIVVFFITLFSNVHDFSRRLSYTPISRLSFLCSVFKVRFSEFLLNSDFSI